MKFNIQKMDTENLDELIKLCEDKMVQPFAKKKVEIVVDQPEEMVTEEDEEEKPDLSDVDLEDLIKMYNDMKG